MTVPTRKLEEKKECVMLDYIKYYNNDMLSWSFQFSSYLISWRLFKIK
jgi:hypothetical protein